MFKTECLYLMDINHPVTEIQSTNIDFLSLTVRPKPKPPAPKPKPPAPKPKPRDPPAPKPKPPAPKPKPKPEGNLHVVISNVFSSHFC